MPRNTPDAYIYYLEISGSCNLQCPSCPQGNFPDPDRPRGLMDKHLFGEILNKIKSESPGKETLVHLYNWGEPTLHPELPRFLEMTHEHRLVPFLSTNLNSPRHLKDIVRAKPRSIRISLSGYSPAIYSTTHQGGNNWLLKSNAYRLRALLDSVSAPISVHFCYHKYTHNTGPEMTKALELASELGFDFIPVWAYLAPLETLLDYYASRIQPITQALVNMLLIKPEESRRIALRHCAQYPECPLRSQQMAIDFDGSLPLCRAVYARQNYLAGNFLDLPHKTILHMKKSHPLCAACMREGAYLYYLYVGPEELNQIAEDRLRKSRMELFSLA